MIIRGAFMVIRVKKHNPAPQMRCPNDTMKLVHGKSYIYSLLFSKRNFTFSLTILSFPTPIFIS